MPFEVVAKFILIGLCAEILRPGPLPGLRPCGLEPLGDFHLYRPPAQPCTTFTAILDTPVFTILAFLILKLLKSPA